MKGIALILICALLLSGCTSKTRDSKIIADAVAAPAETAAAELTEPRNLLDATIYYGNENADGFETTIFQVETLDSPMLIRKLIEVGVLSEGTEILSEEITGTCLFLDFNTTFQNRVCSMGTSGEYIIIGSLVNTFLDNFKDAIESVYITVNGEILESGHVIYDFELTYFD